MTGRASIKRDVTRWFVETIFYQKRTEALDGFMVPDVVLHHSGRACTRGSGSVARIAVSSA